MSTAEQAAAFLRSADDWVCDGYSLDVRYVAAFTANGFEIVSASLLLNPLPPRRTDLSFRFFGSRILIGQDQIQAARRALLLRVLTRAVEGEIEAGEQTLKLVSMPELDFFSEMAFRERWYSELHLQVLGSRSPQFSVSELATADTELRLATPPFDGLADACNWLNLTAPGANTNPSSITIRVGPPVDLIFDDCRLSEGRLTLTLHAQAKFDVSRVRLAVRGAPDIGLLGRQQISGDITWSKPRHGRRPGIVRIDLPEADSALAMLMIEGFTVRRQWFVDPAKAGNKRYLAVQHFDTDLRMLRDAVLTSPHSDRFERGVSTLLFLSGFSPSDPLQTDAPDLIVTTPGGKIAIVECTIRTADISTKVGKLVDRRSSLSKYLTSVGQPAEVIAVLVCRTPIDHLPAQAADAARSKVLLLTNEDLLAALERVRFPRDPDDVLASASARLASQRGSLGA